MPQAPNAPLSERLRAATASLHGQAERSGMVRAILRGRVTPAGYALFLRNLLPAYAALEDGLAAAGGLAPFADPVLRRTARIEADLAALSGPGWPAELALLPAGAAYGAALARAAEAALAGHAYARIFGDLSGARFLRVALARAPGLPDGALSFYDFPGLDLDARKAALRATLDAPGRDAAWHETALEGARAGFRLTIAVSETVAEMAP